MTEDLVERVRLKFTSGNSIRVERAIITHDEMMALLDCIPEGMALVPIEPTEAMLIAGGHNEPFLDDIYKAMIKAAGDK